MFIKKIVKAAAKATVVAAAAVTVWKAYAEVESIIEEDITADKEKAIDIAVAVAPVFMVGFGLAAANHISALENEVGVLKSYRELTEPVAVEMADFIGCLIDKAGLWPDGNTIPVGDISKLAWKSVEIIKHA